MENVVILITSCVVGYIVGYFVGCWMRHRKKTDKYPTPTEETRDGRPERKWEAFEFEGQTLYRLR